MSRTFADLNKYIKLSFPVWKSMAIIMLLLITEFFLSRNIIFSLFIIIVPAIITLGLDQFLSKIYHSRLNFRKNIFLFSITLVIFYVIYQIFSFFAPSLKLQNIAIAISFISFFRYMVFYVYLSENDRINYISANMFAISFIPLFIFNSLYTIVIEVIAYSFISSYLSLLFVRKSTKTFRNEFQQEPRDLIKFFLYSSTSRKYYDSGDRFFKRIYSVEREVSVDMIRFENSAGQNKAALIFPYVHPGPFGTIGSSNLPERLTRYTSEISKDIMVFHTATTNNNNCAGENEIESIGKAIKSMWAGDGQTDKMSRLVSLKSNGIRIDAISFNGRAIVALNPDRVSFDDILYTEGQKAVAYLDESMGIHASIVDAQNNFVRGSREITDMGPYLHGIHKAASRLKSKYPCRIGYYQNRMSSKALGPMGIQALVMDYGDEKDTMILTDSNNISHDLMEQVREDLKDKFKNIGIYTTDNHVVNVGSLDMNPLGESGDLGDIRKMILETVLKASENIEDVRAIYGTRKVRVKMGSEDSYQTLMDTVFTSLKRARIYAAVTIGLTFLIPVIMSVTGIIFRIPFVR
jgi:putative membrane protein